MQKLRNLFSGRLQRHAALLDAYTRGALNEFLDLAPTYEEFRTLELEDLTLLHHAMWASPDAVRSFSHLPYFKELVNDDQNIFGFSPIVWAATQGPVNLESLKILQ